MDFKELFRMARRRWKTISAMFLIAIAVSAAISFTTTPIYHSTARVFISTDVSNSTEKFYQGAFTTQRVASYADLATSRELMKRVIDRLGLHLTPSQLASRVQASVVTDTVIINVDVRDPNPQTAQTIAQAEAEELTKYLSEVEAPAGGGTNGVKATVVDPADYNATAVTPRTALNLVVAGFLGFLIGCAIAALRDVFDTTVKSPSDVEDVMQSPVMAHIQYDPAVPKSPLLTAHGGRTARAEAFRLLRTNLQFLDVDSAPKSFVVSSAVSGEGKTSTSTNLALALAQAGQRVLLVDGDLRRPRVAKLLGLEAAVGLTTVLVGRNALVESIQRERTSGVYVLASGPIPPNPTEILQSKATAELLKRLRDMFDVVIIDAPPLLPVADAAILARHADGAILVVRHGKTKREELRQAVSRLDAVGAKLYGAVVNMTPRRGADSYTYGGYYTYGTVDSDKKA